MTRVMIMAGGTGGHVFPALAVAEELRRLDVEVFWLGTRKGLEAKVVPTTGIDLEWVSVSGLRAKGITAWLLAPFKLGVACVQVVSVILRRRPMVVLGMGGFVTGPGGLISWLLRKPLVIHEQNAVAGLTNRLLARLATRVLEAFPASLPGLNVVCTGNPVRRSIAELPLPAQRYAGRVGALRLLILGGSLGARFLNTVVPVAVKDLFPRLEIRHQAGAHHVDEARAAYRALGVEAQVEPFFVDIAPNYAWADLVVCRAGALTVAELTAVGIGSILVPYPHAVDDHQTHNAQFLVEAGAALLVQQRDLTPQRLSALLLGYCGEGARERLLELAQAARRLARPEAATLVAERCLEAVCD